MDLLQAKKVVMRLFLIVPPERKGLLGPPKLFGVFRRAAVASRKP